jgi:microcystin-dependent protein
MMDPFLGEIKMVGFTFAPMGWAFCNGQVMSIPQNSALFSLLGTTYGGNGTTNFALPNLQGRAPLHAGSGPGLTPRPLGQPGGATTVALGTGTMAAHTHAAMGVSGYDSSTPANSTWGTAGAGRTPPPGYQSGNPNVTMNAAALGSAGSSTPAPHNNMQPYLAVNFIIATMGIYPVRE